MTPEVANLPTPPPIPEGKSSADKGHRNIRQWTKEENAYAYWHVMNPGALNDPNHLAAMVNELKVDSVREALRRVSQMRRYVRNRPTEDKNFDKLLEELLHDDPQPAVVSSPRPSPRSPPALPTPSPPPDL